MNRCDMHEATGTELESTPEEIELLRRRTELQALEQRLVDEELQKVTLERELADFERSYLATVGSQLADLDAFVAAISALLTSRKPEDTVAKATQEGFDRRAEHSREWVRDDVAEHASMVDRNNLDELKQLYREAAKKVHPDLAETPEDALRREEVMKTINAAYGSGDVEALRKILSDWDLRPEAVTGRDVGAELIRVLRKIAQVERRLGELTAKRAEVEHGELYRLWERAEQTRRRGGDLLQIMSAQVQEQIASIEHQLKNIIAEHQSNGGL